MSSKSKKNHNYDLAVYYLLGFMPLFITFFIYPDIPDKIAFDYSPLGEVSKLESKSIILIVPFLLSVFTYISPRLINFKFGVDYEDKVSYYTTLLFMICVNLLIYFQIFVSIKGFDFLLKFNLYNFLSAGMCLTFIYFGNLLSRGPRNCTFCIKTSTYFMDDLSWKLMHNNLGSYLSSSAMVFLPISIFCTSKYISLFICCEILLMIIFPLIGVFRYLNKYKKIN